MKVKRKWVYGPGGSHEVDVNENQYQFVPAGPNSYNEEMQRVLDQLRNQMGQKIDNHISNVIYGQCKPIGNAVSDYEQWCQSGPASIQNMEKVLIMASDYEQLKQRSQRLVQVEADLTHEKVQRQNLQTTYANSLRYIREAMWVIYAMMHRLNLNEFEIFISRQMGDREPEGMEVLQTNAAATGYLCTIRAPRVTKTKPPEPKRKLILSPQSVNHESA